MICPNCRTKVKLSKDIKYCDKCGAKLIEIEEVDKNQYVFFNFLPQKLRAVIALLASLFMWGAYLSIVITLIIRIFKTYFSSDNVTFFSSILQSVFYLGSFISLLFISDYICKIITLPKYEAVTELKKSKYIIIKSVTLVLQLFSWLFILSSFEEFDFSTITLLDFITIQEVYAPFLPYFAFTILIDTDNDFYELEEYNLKAHLNRIRSNEPKKYKRNALSYIFDFIAISLIVLTFIIYNENIKTENKVGIETNSQNIVTQKESNSKNIVTQEDDNDRTYGNFLCNLRNNQIQMAEYNNKLYYCDTSYDLQTNSLCRSNINGDNKEVLNNDCAHSINVYKDKLYYIKTNNEDNVLWKMVICDLDGKSNRQTKDGVTNVWIADDKLYYTEIVGDRIIGYIYPEDLIIVDLKTNKEISRDSFGAGVSDILDKDLSLSLMTPSTGYYIADNTQSESVMNKYGVDGKSTDYLDGEFIGKYQDNYIFRFNCQNNDMFNNELYLYDRKINDLTKLTGKNVTSAIAFNDYLFYFQNSDFKIINLKTSDEINYGEYSSPESTMYVFNNTVYILKDYKLIPIFDLQKNEINKDFQKLLVIKNKNTYPEDLNDFDYINLIWKADGEYLSNKYKSLKYLVLQRPSYDYDEVVRNLVNMWNINDADLDEGFSFYTLTQNADSEMAIDMSEYLVLNKSKKVYRFPNQGGASAYLIENNRVVREYYPPNY